MLYLEKPVVYGDFEGNGQDDAAVTLGCSNNGGTADGALVFSVVVFSGRAGKLARLGLITPERQPANVLPTLLSVASIVPFTITVDEAFYGTSDMTCCASGRATSRWTFTGGKLVHTATLVTTNPK